MPSFQTHLSLRLGPDPKLYKLGEGLDLCELCGGDQARTSQIAIRRRLRTGENFDLVTGYDLNKPNDQQAVWHYFEKRKPIFNSF